MSRLTLALVSVLLLASCSSDGDRSGSDARPVEQAAEMHEFVSQPELTAPVVDVAQTSDEVDPGYVLLLPRAFEPAEGEPNGYALMVDNAGEPMWTVPFTDTDDTYQGDLRIQEYQGEPVITYWEGKSVERGWGMGSYVILDQSYERVATVEVGGDLQDADFHDMLLTERDTAVLVSYPEVEHQGETVREGAIQEVDLTTGEVLFEWHSLDHIDVADSHEPRPDDAERAYDYFHINSIDEDADGNLLISARHTHALYKIDRDSGEVLWQLGGDNSDFELGDGAAFAWQHDAKWLPDNQVSLLDNVSDQEDGPPSRAIVLDLDETANTAELAAEHVNPEGVTSHNQSSHQVTDSGHSFVGWGPIPAFSEFDADGEVVLHATFPDAFQSYRAVRTDWTGQPSEPPAVAARASTRDSVTTHVSWNGATEVADWRVLAGPSEDQLEPAAEAPRDGFETEIEVPTDADYVAVEALDADGKTLDTSPVTQVAAAR